MTEIPAPLKWRHLIIPALFILAVAGLIYTTWPDTECLIYGIDFNGRNEPFGLFC